MTFNKVALLLLAAPLVVHAGLRGMAPSGHLAEVKPHADAPRVAVNGSTKVPPVEDEKAQVVHLRAKLTKISVGLARMLKPDGELAKTKISDTFRTFSAELEKVLKETEHEKDTTKALKSLRAVEASVKVLTQDITQQQVKLMKDAAAQEESLLLGVLMTKQNAPMDDQMEVLKSAEFASLPVVATVLKAGDKKTPLFKQVAAILDGKNSTNSAVVLSGAASEIPKTLKAGKDGKPDVTPIVKVLTARLDRLEDGQKRMAHYHQQEMKEFDDAIKKEQKKNPKTAHHYELLRKNEDHKFKKEAAVGKHDADSLRAAIVAIQKGDMKALAKAQSALQDSLSNMKSQRSKFLVLIQMVHKAEAMDCPYCAAQCVDKCHSDGKPYVQCLTDCADAGKGK